MAVYHVSVQVISRSEGKTATGAAAYRSGSTIVDSRTQTIHTYTQKTGVGHTEILTPIPATDRNAWMVDRSELWNKVEHTEKRKDSQLARELNIAIPVELARQERIDLVREYARDNFIERGMIADICFHDFESNNPHAHIMLTMRELVTDDDGLVSFGKKVTDWNDRNLLIDWRRNWAEIANQYLAKAGYDVKIDHRSLVEQGITDRLPQIHLGANVAAMRERGIATERGDEYDRINTVNAEIRHQLEKIYQAETELEELGKAETSNQQEVNDQPRPHTQEPRPDFSRTRSDLEDLARRPQRHDPGQRERRSQPGADSRINRENRTDRNQPHRDLRTDRSHRAVSNLHPEDSQDRSEPALDQTRPTGAAGESNPDFAAIQAGLIELSHQIRDRDPVPTAQLQGLDRDWSADIFGANVSSNNLDASRHQERVRDKDSASTSGDSRISGATEGIRQIDAAGDEEEFDEEEEEVTFTFDEPEQRFKPNQQRQPREPRQSWGLGM